MQITRRSAWSSSYEIHSGGKVIATWEKQVFRTGGLLTIGNYAYQVKGGFWGTSYELTDQKGGTLGVAERVGRKYWTVSGSGQVYEFRRASMLRADQEHVINGQPVGYIRKTGVWRFGADAELPRLPLPLQMFAIVVTLSLWERNNASAGASA